MTRLSQPTARHLRVFLCYASDDDIVVQKLYQQLKTCDIDPWRDKEKLNGGQEWSLEITRAVRSCDVVVICLSQVSVTKEGYFQREIKLALDVALEKPEGAIYIIPLRLEECRLPERLKQFQWVNYFANDGFDKLLRALEEKRKSLLPRVKIKPIRYRFSNQSHQIQTHSVDTHLNQSSYRPPKNNIIGNQRLGHIPKPLILVIVGILLLSSVLFAYYHSLSNQAPTTSINHDHPTSFVQATVPPVTQVPANFLSIDTLTDNFNTGLIPNSTKWQINTTSGATVTLRGGQQVNSPTRNVESHAITISSRLYNAIGKRAFIQVIQVSAGSTVDTAFGLQNADANDAIQIYYEGGELIVGTYNKPYKNLCATHYNATSQKWWRMRESGGTTYADVSPDGITWVNICHHIDFFDMSHVWVFTNSDEWSADPTAGAAIFDNFNHS